LLIRAINKHKPLLGNVGLRVNRKKINNSWVVGKERFRLAKPVTIVRQTQYGIRQLEKKNTGRRGK